METYGFHTIHGRAPAVATGVKLANPDLDVWIITGDGDGLSIGGNHMMHLLRRNLDCQIMLFNNEIYGLTKGQYSPTSREGTTTPSTPFGSVDHPAEPCSFALGSGARFIARGYDVSKELPEVLKAAHAHKGAAFIEIFQNCIVYNKDVFGEFTEKKNAATGQLWLNDGQPMLFDNGQKGLKLDSETLKLVVVDVADGDWQSAGVRVHDTKNRMMAQMLVDMPFGPFPQGAGCALRRSARDVRERHRRAERRGKPGQDARSAATGQQGPDLDGNRPGTRPLAAALRDGQFDPFAHRLGAWTGRAEAQDRAGSCRADPGRETCPISMCWPSRSWGCRAFSIIAGSRMASGVS